MVRSAIGFTLAAVLFASGASAQSIVNGNFDDFVPTDGEGGGWRTFNMIFSEGWLADTGLPAPCFLLQQIIPAAAGARPTIEQDVSGFEVGESYVLRGDFLGRGDFSGTEAERLGGLDGTFEVWIDDTRVLATGSNSPDWDSWILGFTAEADTHTIRLVAEANGARQFYFVDNIELIMAVPAADASWSTVKAAFSRLPISR